MELAKRYKVAEAVAAKFVSTFHRAFPAVKQWTAHVKRQCHEQGFVTTITQRRRLVVRTDDRDSAARARLDRQAVNSVVQGSASDIMKLAMIAIHKTLATNRNLPLPSSNQPPPPPPRMILQVHDELIFEVAAQARVIAQLVADMRQCMEVHVVESLGLKVPLAVTTMVGPSWGKMRPFVGPAGPSAASSAAAGNGGAPQAQVVRQRSNVHLSPCPPPISRTIQATSQQQHLSSAQPHLAPDLAPASSPFFTTSKPHGAAGSNSSRSSHVPFSQ